MRPASQAGSNAQTAPAASAVNASQISRMEKLGVMRAPVSSSRAPAQSSAAPHPRIRLPKMPAVAAVMTIDQVSAAAYRRGAPSVRSSKIVGSLRRPSRTLAKSTAASATMLVSRHTNLNFSPGVRRGRITPSSRRALRHTRRANQGGRRFAAAAW